MSLHLVSTRNLATFTIMGKILPMTTLYVPISKGRTNLCELLDKVEAGTRVVFTSHGRPKAVLTAFHLQGKPWRAENVGDPSRFGDLQSPVMEEWT